MKNQQLWGMHAAAAAASLQSCPTLCDPVDGSPPGSSVPGMGLWLTGNGGCKGTWERWGRNLSAQGVSRPSPDGLVC